MDIDKLLRDKTKKVLMIVAHPDDEVLFGGGILSKYSGTNWSLACCCEHHRKIPEFLNVASSLGITDIHCLNLREVEYDKKIHILKNIDPVFKHLSSYYREIIKFLYSTKADIIITHNRYGEYGNPTHAIISNIINFYVNLIDSKTIIFSFAANKENIDPDANFILEFNDELYEKKKKLIHLYPGKDGTLMKFNIVHCRREALYYESY